MSDARRQTLALLDAGRPEEALRAAEQLLADDPNAVQVLAFAEIVGGEQLVRKRQAPRCGGGAIRCVPDP
jgi:hypothetical protein